MPAVILAKNWPGDEARAEHAEQHLQRLPHNLVNMAVMYSVVPDLR